MNKSLSVIKLLGALVFTIGVLFTSCKKEEIQGPKGDPGDPGIGGNANVVSTNTFIVNSAAWVADSVAECLKVTISFTMLTQDVIDKGSVKVYKQTTTTGWSELPLTTSDLFTQFGFDVGNLYLNYHNIEGGMPGPAPATARYRMVIVSEVPRYALPQTSSENYINKGKENTVVK